jgi:cobalt-zinc-cadmium efflux system outer membrane protein
VKHIVSVWMAWLTLLCTAAPAAQRTLTLEEAVALALKNNPGLLQAEKDVESARGRRWQLESVPNPALVFSREGLGDKDRGGESEFNLGIKQVIEFPGKRALRRQVGELGEEASRLELERLRVRVAAGVEAAYWQAVYARETARSLEAVDGVLKNYLDLAREKYRYGQAAYLDVLRGEVESLKVRNEMLEAGREFRGKSAALSLLVGQDEEEEYLLTTGLVFVAPSRTMDQLLQEVDQSPKLRLAAAELKQAETAIDLARRSAFPDLEVSLFYPSQRASAWGFEVGLEIPLWQKKRQGEVLEAVAHSQRSRISLEAARSRRRIALRRLFSDLQAGEKQLRLFEQGLLKDVEDAWQTGLSQYQYGRTDSLNLLDIYRSYKETKREYLRTLLNTNLSLAEIKAAGDSEME